MSEKIDISVYQKVENMGSLSSEGQENNRGRIIRRCFFSSCFFPPHVQQNCCVVCALRLWKNVTPGTERNPHRTETLAGAICHTPPPTNSLRLFTPGAVLYSKQISLTPLFWWWRRGLPWWKLKQESTTGPTQPCVSDANVCVDESNAPGVFRPPVIWLFFFWVTFRTRSYVFVLKLPIARLAEANLIGDLL